MVQGKGRCAWSQFNLSSASAVQSTTAVETRSLQTLRLLCGVGKLLNLAGLKPSLPQNRKDNTYSRKTATKAA